MLIGPGDTGALRDDRGQGKCLADRRGGHHEFGAVAVGQNDRYCAYAREASGLFAACSRAYAQ